MNPNATTLTPARTANSVVWLGIVVLLSYWVVTMHRLGGLWSALPEYSYGWAVPMLCVILFMDRWRTRPTASLASDLRPPTSDRISAFSFQRFSISPLIFLLSVLMVFVFSRAALEVIPTWRIAAWTMTLSAIVLTLLGLKYFSILTFQRFSVSYFAFPILFFLIAVPWPSRFEDPFIQTLTELNAALTVEIMSFFKVAAVRMGNQAAKEAPSPTALATATVPP